MTIGCIVEDVQLLVVRCSDVGPDIGQDVRSKHVSIRPSAGVATLALLFSKDKFNVSSATAYHR